VLLLTENHAMKAYWGSGWIAPRILSLGTRWRWVVSFTLRSLYPRERTPAHSHCSAVRVSISSTVLAQDL